MDKKSATNDDPNAVGIRDLRDNLSRHLEKVRLGVEVTVTDHGKPVARLVPYDGRTKFERMIAEGKITPAKEPKGKLPPPLKIEGGLSHLLWEERRR